MAVAQLRRLPPNIQGALWLVSGGFIFTSNSAMIRLLSAEIESVQTAFFRAVFSVLLLAPMMLNGRVKPWQSERIQGHFWRTAMGTTSMVLGFYAVSMLPLADATAIAFSQPMFSVVVAALIAGEKVRWRRWSATIVGFAGVLVMVRPGAGVFDWAAAWPLAAAVLYAAAMMSIRKLGSTEPSTTIVFHFTAFATLASLLTIPLGLSDPAQAWVMPSDPREIMLIVVIGVFGGIAQIFMTMAYQRARAATVASFDYTALVYGFLLGWMFFAEVPDAYLIVGGLIVVAAGIYIIHRETVVARQQHREPPVPPLPTNE